MTRPVWVALLRGVNVGGARRLPMADLRRALADRGAADVRTYLQSGNVVLTADGDAAAAAELVRAAAGDLGVECDVVVRDGDALAELVRRNPWPDRAEQDPTKLNVGFLSAAGDGSARGLAADEEVRFDGAEVWIWYGSGAGRSRLSLDVGDRALTVRNWRTVTALAELAGS